MKRVDGWDKKMFDLIEEAKNKPYVIGVHDCAIFTAEVVSTVTGVDYSSAFKGKYTTKLGSAKLVATLSGDKPASLKAAVEHVLQASPVNWALVHRGGILLYIDGNKVEHLGVCLGGKTVVLGEDGLISVPTSKMNCGWAI